MMNNKERILELATELRKELFKANKDVSQKGMSLPNPITSKDYLNDCVLTHTLLTISDTLDELGNLISCLNTCEEEKHEAFVEIANKECDGDLKELSSAMRKAVMDSLLKELANMIGL